MNKTYIGIISLIIISMSVSRPVSAESYDALDELKQEEQDLRDRQLNIEDTIDEAEETLDVLEQEKMTLMKEVADLQDTIDTLMAEIEEQEAYIDKTTEDIAETRKEISRLEEEIAKRAEQLNSQARTIQKVINPASIIDMLVSAQSVSDIIGLMDITATLVSTNARLINLQEANQAEVEEKQAALETKRQAIVDEKKELEINRNNILNQRIALDEKILKTGELHSLTEAQRLTYIAERDTILSETSQVNEEIARRYKEILEQERLEEQAVLAEIQKQKDLQQQASVQAVETASSQTMTTAVSTQSVEEKVEPVAVEAAPEPAAPPAPSPAPAETGWVRPAVGRISSPFGFRIHPVTRTNAFHTGVDIAGSGAILATRSGVVLQANYSGGYGYQILIDHGDGYQSRYAHLLANMRVAPGQTVSQGQQIGTMGSTGMSTGVHLHFEIIKNGSFVNPMHYMQ